MQPKFLIALLLLFLAMAAHSQTPAIDKYQKIVAQGKRDSVELLAHLGLANEYARDNMAAAKRSSQSAAVLAKQLNLPILLSAAYSLLVTLNAQTNQTDSAKYYLDVIKKLADKSGVPIVRMNYNFTAGLFYRRQGDYKTALPYMLECLRLETGGKDKTSMAGQNLNIGNCYSDMSQYRNAMTYHLKALNLFEAVANKRGMSFCYSAIGGDFIKLNQYSAAMPYIQKSITLKNELNDKRGIATSYVYLGAIQDGLQHPDKALSTYRQALAINRALLMTMDEAKTTLAIGKLYAGKNNTDSARAYLNRSAALFSQLRDTSFLATVNAELASLQKNSLQQKATEKTFISALKTSMKSGDKNAEISNYKYLSDFYAKNKQFDKALAYNEKYHNQFDSVQNVDLQVQVKKLEQQYNFEKKEKEISLLKKDRLLDKANLQNQKIFRYGSAIVIVMLIAIGLLIMGRYRVVQRARRLVEIEKMRNNIARNLHDDIGSTLSSINILSKVALKQVTGNIKVSKDLETIKDSSFSIMESMSDIVWAINPANDPLDKTILKMREFAAMILEPAGIAFTFTEDGKLADLKLGVDERKNFYLIFKEAINNIAKYSGATSADIVLLKTPHRFILKITDNGKGFDSTTQYTGNGLKNMRNRAHEMHAEYEIKSAPDAGTRICVTVPVT